MGIAVVAERGKRRHHDGLVGVGRVAVEQCLVAHTWGFAVGPKIAWYPRLRDTLVQKS